MSPSEQDVLNRELAYHEQLYSGFAQRHFARPAVRALREHLALRVLKATGAWGRSRVLSLGCGIGDTELLIAPQVHEVAGIDLSPAGISQAREDATRQGVMNARFQQGETPPAGEYDVVIAIFFLHHLSDSALAALPGKVRQWLRPGGVFYSLDPSRSRLSGAIGRFLLPGLMKRYQTPDERELEPERTAALFRDAGFQVQLDVYDFASTPLAGLLPGWRMGYRVARAVDDWLLRIGLVRRRGSNFELIARG
jgi:SAM-dependent methyltransferase